AANEELVAAARKAPGLTQVFSPFTANTPQVFVDIDRVKAQKLGVPITNVNETIQTYFGSTYVNDFNLFGRTYHVTAQADLPFRREWTDLSYQQVTGGNAGLYVFPICVLFVFLVLAAQYGSWSLPFAVILIVPMCLLAATLGVRIMGQDVNILTQIGFVVLVGLAAKN